MENDNGIPKEPAEKEFALIKDLLSVPQEGEAFSEHRRWHGGCLFFQLPDLVPVNPDPDNGPRGFCWKGKAGPNKGKLIVKVNNQGAGNATKQTTTKVTFSTGDSYERKTPALKAYEPKDLDSIEFPPECATEGCEFEIEVNANGDVKESNIKNNKAKGICTPDVIVD